MLSALPFAVFLLLVAFVIPSILNKAGSNAQEGLYFMTIVSVLAPLVYAIRHFWKAPEALARYIAQSVIVQLSLIPEMAWHAIVVVTTRKNFFVATADPVAGSNIAWQPVFR